MTNLENIAPLPLKGSPLPHGTRMAADSVHHRVHSTMQWPLARPVLDLYGDEPADLVLLAVPAGMGGVLASWIAHQMLAVETTAPEGKEPS